MKHGVSLKQLEIFCAVVVAGSITKAARRTGLSQPSISQQLARVEEQLGTQLILRSRAGQVALTAAGDYWFKAATDLIQRYDAAVEAHGALFAHDTVTLRLGTTTTFRSRFVGMAARIALEVDPGARFSHHWCLESSELVDRLRLHQLNCALVGRSFLEKDLGSFTVTPCFTDALAWVVPAEVPEEALVAALGGAETPLEEWPVLARSVALVYDAPLQPGSEDWFRRYLPHTVPSFAVQTYSAAVDLVTEGLATAHCPLSLLPNLPPSVERRLRWYRIDWLTRELVLAMPKHLLTLTAFARIHAALSDFAATDYAREMVPAHVGSFRTLAARALGGCVEAAGEAGAVPAAQAPARAAWGGAAGRTETADQTELS